MTTIKLKNGSGAPAASDLVQGEPAFDLTNKRLYTENASGTVIEVGTNPGVDVTFADNRKAIFGAGSDLQIYHDGSNSLIQDAGNGDLIVKSNGTATVIKTNAGNNLLSARDAGSVGIFHDGSEKLTTTSTGIDVTGTVTADGSLIGDAVSGSLSQTGMLTVSDTNTTNTWTNFTGTAAYLPFAHELAVVNLADATTNSFAGLYFMAGETSAASGISSARIGAIRTGASTADLAFSTRGGGDMIQAMRIAGNGDISFYEDTGTTAKLFWDASAERLVLSTSGAYSLDARASGTSSATMAVFSNSNGSDKAAIRLDASGDGELVLIDAGNNEDVVITSGGDSYFNGGNVGIGTSNPSKLLHVSGTSDFLVDVAGSDSAVVFKETGGNSWRIGNDSSTDAFVISQSETSLGTNVKFFIADGGNVGIGTSSVGRVLHVEGTPTTFGDTQSVLQLADDTAMAAGVGGGVIFTGKATTGQGDSNTVFGSLHAEKENGTSGNTAGALLFSTRTSGSNPAERMRIDSSGNLLVGKTSADNTTQGVRIYSTGRQSIVSEADTALIVNRRTSDGTIAEFRKDGTTVGSIGASGGRLFIADDAQAGFAFASGANRVVPCNSSGTLTDATMDIAEPNYRFKDLYLSGTTNVSGRHLTAQGAETTGYQFIGDGDSGMYQQASNQLQFSTAGSERMRLDSSGNLLVGTTETDIGFTDSGAGVSATPTGYVQVARSSVNELLYLNKLDNDGDIIRFSKDGTEFGAISLSSSNNLSISGTVADHSGVLFGTHIIYPTEAGSLANGTIALGDSSYPFKDIVLSGTVDGGNGSAAAPTFTFSSDTNTGMFRVEANTLGFSTNGAEEMRLTAAGDLHVDGNVIAYSTTISDRRLKSDITNISDALDKVGQINGVTFVRNHNGEKAAGIVAQEIMEVLPEAVKSQALPLQTGEQDQEYYVVEYDAVTGLLVEAVKELKARVEALENS